MSTGIGVGLMKINAPLNEWLQWWDLPLTVALREEALEKRRKCLRLLGAGKFDNLTEVYQLQAQLSETTMLIVEPAREIARLYARDKDEVGAEKWEKLARSLEMGGNLT